MTSADVLLQLAARDASTKFPLDDIAFDISSMAQQTLINYAKAGPRLHSLGGVTVSRISQNLVVKFGTGVLASEGLTMSFVATNFPGVRLPRVYRHFNVPCQSAFFGMEGYVVMDYLDGYSLESCWSDLSTERKKAIVAQVAEMVHQLQSKRFKQPGVVGGGISRGRWFTDYGAGPFTTKQNFERWFNWKLGLGQHFNQVAKEIPSMDFQYFVVVHGDLSPRNLIVDANNQVWLIDWGFAGIYPPIFETATLSRQMHFPDFAQLLGPFIYKNDQEMVQLESCMFGLINMSATNPPEYLWPVSEVTTYSVRFNDIE